MGSTLLKNIHSVAFNAEQYGEQKKYVLIVGHCADKNCRPIEYKKTILAHGFQDERGSLYSMYQNLSFSAIEGGMYHHPDGTWWTPEEILETYRKLVVAPKMLSFNCIGAEFIKYDKVREIMPFDSMYISSSKVDFLGTLSSINVAFIEEAKFKKAVDFGVTDWKDSVNILRLHHELQNGDACLMSKHYFRIELNF